MTDKKYLLLILLFSLVSIVKGETRILSLEEAWNIMEVNNDDLNKLYLQWGAALRESESTDHWLPSLSAGVGLSRSSPLISAFTNSETNAGFDERENWSVRGSVDMSWRLSPGISQETEIRYLREELLRLQIQEKIRSLKYDLTVLYYEILAGKDRISLQEESLVLAESRLELAQLKYDQGLLSDLDLLSSRLSAARDVPALQKERTDQEKRFITLRSYLGLEGNQDIKLVFKTVESISLPEKDEAIAGVDASTSLRILDLQIQSARLVLESAEQRAYWPSFSMSLGWSTGINPLFSADSWSSGSWRDSLGFGLSLSIPLDSHFRGSSEKLNLLELEEAIEIAEINRRSARNDLENRIRTLYMDMELSRSNIDLQELNVSLLEQTYLKMEQVYSGGRLSLSDLDNSRQEWKEALLSLEEEKRNLTEITIEIAYLLGLN